MFLYLQLDRFSLSIFSFSERLFSWHKRFFRFGWMPALPKLILFGFIFLLQNGKISLIQVLQYQVSSLLLRYSWPKSLTLLHLIWIHFLHKSQHCFITSLDDFFTKRTNIIVMYESLNIKKEIWRIRKKNLMYQIYKYQIYYSWKVKNLI